MGQVPLAFGLSRHVLQGPHKTSEFSSEAARPLATGPMWLS
jgi:hypothetical protein